MVYPILLRRHAQCSKKVIDNLIEVTQAGNPKRNRFMYNPPNSYPSSGSFDDLLKRMTQRMRENKIDTQIVGTLQQVFEKKLSTGNIVLSRPERARLFREVSEAILTDVLGKIGDTK